MYKHWQGKLPLAVSFWINFVLLNFVIGSIRYFIYTQGIIENPVVIVREFIFFSIFMFFIFYPWQIIGLWRSCHNHIKKTGRRFWARLGQIIVILFLIVLSVKLTSSLPGYKEHLRTGFRKDTELEDYTITLKKNNTLIRLDGELRYGISKDVANFLRKYPNVKGIILDSFGGRPYEGRALARLISTYGLDTYSIRGCHSAATTAFIAGKNRFLVRGANLGFHRPRYDKSSNKYIKKSEAKDMLIFQRQGVKQEFIDKLFNTPYDDVYFPKYSELLKAGVVHKIVKFSDIIPEVNQTNPNDFNEVSLNDATFEAIRKYEPEIYQNITKDLNIRIRNGADVNDMQYFEASYKKKITEHNLYRTSNEAAIGYAKELLDNLKKLEEENPFLCLKSICPEEYGYINLFDYIDEPNQMIDAMNKVIVDAYKKHNPAINAKAAERLLTKLTNKLGDDANCLNIETQDLQNSKQYKQYCDVVIRFYELILSEDKAAAGNALRYLFSQSKNEGK
ncbi:MAG: hypothetical protein NTW93_04875 [Phycisphaerae bacterium]|nr:hypothetical protein [Phycisphaerae bacterium]